MLGLGHLELRESFNKRLTFSIFLIAFSQFNFGFDQQGYAAVQAMDAFARQFGVYNPTKKAWELEAQWLSYFNGFMYLGQAAGVLIGSQVSRRYGRRMCMFSMSIWAIVCATIAITSKSPHQILVARVLNYIYIGMELAVVPIYQSEITPKKSRGFVVGTYQISLMLGGLVMNCIARGTGSIKSNVAWQIPLGLFYVVPTIVALLVWFIPESPRYLVIHDRHDEALRALTELRVGKQTEQQITEEFAIMVDSIGNEPQRGTFADIFRGTNMRRTLIVVGANVLMQAIGQQFTSIYGALYAKSLGTVNPFNVTIAIAVVNVATAWVAMTLIDRMGRRFMILVGATIQVASLMTMGGLGTTSAPGFSIKSGIIAMMVVFNFGYSFGWAPSAHILSAEIPSTRCRDMTYRTASVLNILTQFVVTFSLPYLLYAPYAELGSKVGFIFGSIAAVSIVFVYFCVPDCNGRSLEETEWLFENHTPTRKFASTKVDLQQAKSDDFREAQSVRKNDVELREDA
ncbi:sugar transporter [Apiospora kogelbergensis]|uniref:sugar transporter n=1 Tax=Apiospora kogelbergensis TaxID=1337665 RepID=UPI00312CD319